MREVVSVSKVAVGLSWVVVTASAGITGAATVSGPEAGGWSFRVEGGRTAMHASDRTGGAFAVRAARSLAGSSPLLVTLGAEAGGADQGYLVVDGGVELQPWRTRAFTPYGAFRVGLLAEPEFAGPAFVAEGGVSIRPGPGFRLRAGYGVGVHGGEKGPGGITVGIELGGR